MECDMKMERTKNIKVACMNPDFLKNRVLYESNA